jgi:hypothetical protein
MKQTDSQNALIKGWLLNGYSITQLEALNQFGCFRLAARIADLRDQGFKIDTKIVTLENGKRVAMYMSADEMVLNKKYRDAAERIKLDL